MTKNLKSILWIFPVLISFLLQETRGLRGVRLEVRPSAVQRGGSVTLQCLYELEGAPLYAVKFYRGTHEFYRHSPSELPANKVFPFPGIYVDQDLSNSSQVVLREVSFALAGNFSCEVTTDAPSFSTAFVSEQMTVIELPLSGPKVYAERDRYTLGDTLRANCTSPPSRPPAELTFQVNGMAVGVTSWSHVDVPDEDNDARHGGNGGGIGSSAWLSVQLLPAHFSGASGGSVATPVLKISCTARIAAAGYREIETLQLPARLGEPVHQRVMSLNSASRTKFSATMASLVFLIALF